MSDSNPRSAASAPVDSVDSATADDPGPVAHGEWLYLAALLTVAGVLRFGGLSEQRISHFDEGVYASGIFCSHLTPAYEYPLRHLYAPPLWPSVLAETITWFGADAVLIPGAVLGFLTVPLLWWVGRAWFGPTGAAVGATLLALSDIHVLFSRSALTDAPMTLLMLASVFAAWRGLIHRHTQSVVVAGLLAALCWSTKYNGWLSLAVILSATAAWRFVERRDDRVVNTRPLLRCLIVVAIALAGWGYVISGLQDVGGYQSVSQNHRQYFVGPFGWWQSARHQLALAQVAASSGTVWPLIGLVAFGLLAIRPFSAGISFFIASVLGTRARLLTYVVPAVGTSIKSLKNLTRGVRQTQARKLGTWMTLSWLFGLTLAIPLYTPYLRLTVPLVVIGSLAWADLASRHDRVNWTDRRHVAVAFVILLTITVVHSFGERSTAIARADALSNTGVDQTADAILELIPSSLEPTDPADVGLYVFGEPALYFHLAKRESTLSFDFITQPAANDGVLDRSRTDSSLTPFVVVGPHSEEKQRAFTKDGRLEFIKTFTAPPSLLVALDREPLPGLKERPFRPTLDTFLLFRVNRASEASN